MANSVQTKNKIIKNDIKYKDFEKIFTRFIEENEYTKKSRLEDVEIIKNIYSDNFEPSIPTILNMVIGLLKGDIKRGESIATKVAALKDEIYRGNNNISNKIKSEFNDLYEQINLEISRYNAMTDISQKSVLIDDDKNNIISKLLDKKIDKKTEEYNKVAEESKNNTLNVQRELKKMDDRLEKNSMSSITSLTIFSAVILALTGGISFISGVFGGIGSSSKFRLIFTIGMLGLVLFNLIYFLLFVVAKMTDRNIEFDCNYYNVSEGICKCGKGFCNKKRHKASLACIISKKYTYWIIPNILLLLILYYDGFFYFINYPSVFDIKKLTGQLKRNIFWFPVFLLIIISLFKIIRNIFQIYSTYRMYKVKTLEKYITIEEENRVQNTFASIINNLFKSMINYEKTGGVDELLTKGDNLLKIKIYICKEAIKKTVSISEQKYVTVQENIFNSIKLHWYYHQVKKVMRKYRKDKKIKIKEIQKKIKKFIDEHSFFIIVILFIIILIIDKFFL